MIDHTSNDIPVPVRREVRFNRVYVIQSLDSDEKQTGSILYNDFLRWQHHQLNKLSAELIEIKSKEHLIITFDQIRKKIYTNTYYPYIHFEVHGTPEGLVLNSSELVTWDELVVHLESINWSIQNNLFVSFATCYGAKIFDHIDISRTSPFFGFLAPTDEVLNNDIELGFYKYFETLFATFNGNQAIKMLNDCLSAGSSRFIYQQSEQVFEMIANRYVQKLSIDPHFKHFRTEQLYSKLKQRRELISRYTDEQLKLISSKMIEDQAHEQIQNQRDKFLIRISNGS